MRMLACSSNLASLSACRSQPAAAHRRWHRAARCPAPVLASASSSKGFNAEAGGKAAKKKQPKLARYLDDSGSSTQPGGSAAVTPGEGWSEVGLDPATAFLSKPVQPFIFPTGKAICLYKVGDEIFASDASSTAFRYPLADASILSVKGKPAVESPLDGTVYSLRDGAVISWCPKSGGNVARNLLNSLKDRSTPVPLPVYPTKVAGGKLFVRLSV